MRWAYHSEEAYNERYRLESLINEYKPMINNIIHRFRLNIGDYRIDYDELYQEALIALHHARNCFKGDDEDFDNYVYVVVRRRIWKRIAKEMKTYSFEAISLDNIAYGKDSSVIQFKNSRKHDDPKNVFKLKTFEKQLKNLYLSFNPLQRAIINNRVNEVSYKDIARNLNISTKKVDNEVQKMKRKIKEVLNNHVEESEYF